MDNATKKNMEELIEIGTRLLKKPASRVSKMSGLYDPIGGKHGTNEQELKHFAKILSEERKLRFTNQKKRDIDGTSVILLFLSFLCAFL